MPQQLWPEKTIAGAVAVCGFCRDNVHGCCHFGIAKMIAIIFGMKAVIASEAKQSSFLPRKEAGLLRRYRSSQ
jgi:hypothetical protein